MIKSCDIENVNIQMTAHLISMDTVTKLASMDKVSARQASKNFTFHLKMSSKKATRLMAVVLIHWLELLVIQVLFHLK